MISPDRLERYSDFVDPERTGTPYDPRRGLEKLMGVLSPDPKGIVLAVMEKDWYGGGRQLQSDISMRLRELGLDSAIWPITASADWSYLEYRKEGVILDGSLIGLGAVVKKIEDSSQILYSRSVAGAELAVPLVQQAVRFVSKAREYGEAQRLGGKKPHKFDSMWRIISAVNSTTDQRRPLAIWDVIDFLSHNPGELRQVDLLNQTHIYQSRLRLVLTTLGDCGIIDYQSPMKESDGQTGKAWSVYTLADPVLVMDLDPNKIHEDIRSIRENFRRPTGVKSILDHIKEFPDREYEYRGLAKKLKCSATTVSGILSALADLDILKRPNPGFKGGETVALVSANDLTHFYYDLVCAPAKEIADTLSPLPLGPWNSRELAIYLENYNEERSHRGANGSEEAKDRLLTILLEDGSVIKLSHIVDLYNRQSERQLGVSSVRYHLGRLLKSGEIEQPKPRHYRRVQT